MSILCRANGNVVCRFGRLWHQHSWLGQSMGHELNGEDVAATVNSQLQARMSRA